MESIVINNEYAYKYILNPNYYVTRSGKIYSIYVVGGRGSVDINNPHLVKCGVDKDGYLRIVMSFKGKKRYVKVHTVVVEQFIGAIDKNQVVNHIDGNKQNNNVENLEITSVKYNTIHAHKNNLISRDIPVYVQYKNTVYSFSSMKECMKKFPEISSHYLHQSKNNEILFSMVYFKKQNPEEKVSKIEAYYNGELFQIFNNMKEASLYFGKSRGAVYAAMKNNNYRKKINKYIITFPNVSTIENADNKSEK